ncbi:hypothetical protein GLUCOINTEAF2_0203731 [Komagataeibacter intermedius AF2]|uniref:Uncharacterized protein n=1 Tax=Komagataeibacter intermedius AF2 TaxID=1458464 RepID=A0A0N1N731_9PROT|nr:hypothetical protein GLUCOINTEAF2_0203731 [Komagataeibacter intermedius AF2]
MRLTCHEQPSDMSSHRQFSSPSRRGINFCDSPDTKHFQSLGGPPQRSDRLDHRCANRIIGPDTTVNKLDLIRRIMCRQKCRSRSSSHRCIYGQLPKISLQSRMVGRLIDVNAFQYRVPRRDKQSSCAFPKTPFSENAVESSAEFCRLIFAANPVPRASPALTEPITNSAVLLIENCRSALLIKFQNLVCRKS